MGRYVVLFLTIIVFIYSVHAQTPSSTIAFEERVHDFGTILEKNGKVSHTFVFQNKGTTPIAVDNIYSGCGCISKVLSKEAVKPGGSGRVIITFNPEYKSGFFSKEVMVYSNGGQNYNRIWVQGVIKPSEHSIEDDYPYSFGDGLYLRLKVMAFGYLKPGETRQMKLNYANSTDREMTLNFVVNGNARGLKFVNPGKIAPKAKGVMLVTYTMPYLSNDNVVFNLSPVVNNKKLSEALEVKILNESKLKFERSK